ncbi:MAG TPA: molybdopterin-binding/glycosyltransferase family 2 protein [Candidatus Cybelea sp.]|nr:molybdopterin-binding/glycosyltransferase family 2 protein [Candidatus Cybelea sp.]
MIFDRLPLDQAEGAFLGHSTAAGRLRLKKGHRLLRADLDALRAAGHTSVIAAKLEPGDVPEDEAAAAVATKAAGDGVKVQAAFTGRCNLYADVRGVAVIDGARVDRINAIDEALTIATVAPFEVVEPGQMLATVKIIPFSAPEGAVARGAAITSEGGPLVRVAPFVDHPVGLVMSRLPATKPSILDKTVEAVRERVEALGSHLVAWLDCAHDEVEIGRAIAELLSRGCKPVLVFGASAIVDRRDVVPAGIVRAGGTVDHFGMPVDPGNLLLLAHRGDTTVIGLPGCARSPKLNGFDWVLRRVLADLPVTRADITRMGAGGLLMEIPSRPQPRQGERAPAPRTARIAAVVLAAGQSRRMGRNKLLEVVDGKPMVLSVVDMVLATAARPVVVVTGHQADAVRQALQGRDVRFVHNPDFAAGLSTSLRAGIAALPQDCDGAFVCLGDMPRISPRHLDKLVAAFNPTEGRAIVVPTFGGKRGNPVLWAAKFFPEMKSVAGDVGAKHLIGEHADDVREVPVDDGAVLLDIDTPQALAAARAAGG